jgi:CO/xanthine dehydrogenase Mo-binding subunit
MKKEQINDQELLTASEHHGMPRRDFFKLMGGGIFIFLRPWGALDLIGAPADQARGVPTDYNAFLRIAEDGMVTCYTGKIEMGQGIITSLPQEMADELSIPVEKIKIIMGDTDICPWDQGTWGSLSTRIFGQIMRTASAEARGVLLDLASSRLSVPVAQLEVRDGIITDTKDPKKSVSYAELAKGKKMEKFLDIKPPMLDYRKFKSIGKSYNRADSELKVTGAAKYTGDMKLPGMVFARILRPPSHAAKLTSVDYSAAEKIAGTKVVRDGDFIAVINEDRDKADEAIVKIKAEYSFNEEPVNDKTIYEYMLKADSTASALASTGDIETGRKLCEKTFDSEYHDPYLAHCAMETHTALASLEGDKMTVWASTQSPFGLREGVMRELKMQPDKVRVITPFVGGGFGGKGEFQQGVEAAKLAKMTGKPVMLMWTREEEFFLDTFHPAGVIKVNSGIDKSGMIKFWDYKVYYSGTRGAEPIYDIPNVHITHYNQKKGAKPVHQFGTGAWRAPNNNTNTFAREVQIDIMAAAAGIDPMEFRKKNLKDENILGCLKALEEKFGYTGAKGPSRRGIGIACGADAGAWVAHMAEVKVDKTTGKVTLVRIACAQDMGMCVNPEGATIQMEGCLTMGMGYTLGEEVLFEGGKIKTLSLDVYDIPKFSWLPKIETFILDRQDKPPQGGGEPAIIGVGAAVANAIFDATGARLYMMPFTPERVLAALKKV